MARINTAALVALATSAVLAGPAGAQQATDQSAAKPGFLMWSAFECSTFAELAGDKEVRDSRAEQTRLFRLGLSAGSDLLKGIRNGTIDVNRDVPAYAAMSLAGPSDDFIVGRLFDMASREAFDSVRDTVIQKDDRGVERAPANWLDDDLKAATAGVQYVRANCSLVR